MIQCKIKIKKIKYYFKLLVEKNVNRIYLKILSFRVTYFLLCDHLYFLFFQQKHTWLIKLTLFFKNRKWSHKIQFMKHRQRRRLENGKVRGSLEPQHSPWELHWTHASLWSLTAPLAESRASCVRRIPPHQHRGTLPTTPASGPWPPVSEVIIRSPQPGITVFSRRNETKTSEHHSCFLDQHDEWVVDFAYRREPKGSSTQSLTGAWMPPRSNCSRFSASLCQQEHHTCSASQHLCFTSQVPGIGFYSKDMLLPPIAAGHVCNVSVIRLCFTVFKIKIAKIGMVLYSWYPLSHFKSSLYLWYIITPVEKLMLRKLKWLTQQDHLARDWQSKDSVTGLTTKEQSIHVPWLCLQLLHRNLLEMQTFNPHSHTCWFWFCILT